MARIVVCLSALLVMVEAEFWSWHWPSATIYVNAIYDEGSKAYYRIHTEPATWLTAYTTCVEEGGQLAVATGKNKPFLMSHYPSAVSRVFLGFDNWETGSWRTIHGQFLNETGYEDWYTGEPDNLRGNQRCGVIYPNGRFGDRECIHKFPFICQMNAFPQGYAYYEGTKTYYKFHVKPATWFAAHTACVDEGGRLAVINSQEEANYFVRNFPSNAERVFLGFNNWEIGSWLTIDGKPLSEAGYEKWAPGQRNNKQQRCGAMYSSGELDANHCGTMLPFICEKIETEAEINHNEQTLRVTFVAMQPYQEDYSNRDSLQFQNLAKSLASAVNKIYEDRGRNREISGTQRASVVRIQSRTSDDFSCKVTLDIVTTGYYDMGKIAEILRKHIQRRRVLEGVFVSDLDFSANVIDPDYIASSSYEAATAADSFTYDSTATTEGSWTIAEEIAPSTDESDDWYTWGPTEGETTDGYGTTAEDVATNTDDWYTWGPTKGETTDGYGTTAEDVATDTDDWYTWGLTESETTEGSSTTAEEMATGTDDWYRWGSTEGEKTEGSGTTAEEMATGTDDWYRWGSTEGEKTEGSGTTAEEMATGTDDWYRWGSTEGEKTEGSGTTAEKMATGTDDWYRWGSTEGEKTEGSGTTAEEMASSTDDWYKWGTTEGETDANGPTRCEDSPHYTQVCKRVVSDNRCHRKLYSKMCCKSCSKAARGI